MNPSPQPATEHPVTLLDLEPRPDDLLAEVIHGLSQPQKLLPCKFMYDKRGSELFDRICELPEYYPTRTEMGIMRDHAGAIARRVGPGALVIELGSGSSTKTRLLLDALPAPAGYVPIDISREHLVASAEALARAYPGLPVLPVCADYSQPLEVPAPPREPARRVVYFPGSTIGNLHGDDARAFFRRLARLVGPGGGLLLGYDLVKDPAVMTAAYSDEQGVTAEFNYNLLDRINREAGADFDRGQFTHRAVWNPAMSRMESHLVSDTEQTVHLAGRRFRFDAGETIRTECSYKYTDGSIAELAEGLEPLEAWTDPRGWFRVAYLRAV